MSSCCSECSVCSSVCTRIFRVSMRLCSLLPILPASPGLCRPRGSFDALDTRSPSRFSEVNSYGLEMRLFDPWYVNHFDEAFTVRTENCVRDPRSNGLAVKDWHQYHFLQCQTVSRVLEVNKKQCQQSQFSLAAPCQHSTESHVITLFVSLPGQSADICWNNKNWQLAENCFVCILTP